MYLPKSVYMLLGMEIGPVKYIEAWPMGVKPTFHDPAKAEVVIEVNIFDFDTEIFMANDVLALFLETRS